MGFRLGDWVVRPIEGVVVGANESRHLQPKTMDVLVSLAASKGQVITRDELISRVWGANAVSDEPLTRCIHELRRSLDDDRGEPTYIQTIPKRGYRLLTEVRELLPEDLIQLETPVARENPLRQVTRQRVLWVGMIYAALAWLFVQLARLAESQANAELVSPEWLMPVLVITLLLGFPIAVFYAWVQQVRFDGSIPALSDSGTLRGMRNLLWSRRGIDMVLVTLVISILAGVALDIVPSSDARPIGPSQFSMAVMPFTGNKTAAEDNWLGKGLAEDLHTRLLTNKSLAVSSISVSFRDSIQSLRPQQLGNELNVKYLLRGQIIRGEETLRIKAFLIDAVTGLEVWAQAFNRETTALFAIEEEISAGVLEYLGQKPLPENAESTAIAMNMTAYESYLRGRDQLRDVVTREAAAEAALWFRHALATDERMPMARSGLCQAYVMEMELGGADGIYGKANSACAEAILESPDSVEAHLVLADFYRVTDHAADAVREYQWVVDRQSDNASGWFGLAQAYADTDSMGDAEQAYRRVLEIKPDCADAHEAFVSFLIDEGRYTEALEIARYLVQLDSDRVKGYEYLATALFMNGQFKAAIRASREVLSRDIEHRAAVMTIARSYYFMGRYQNAINIYRQAAKLNPEDHVPHGGLASAYAQLEDPDSQREAQQAFARARYLAERELLLDADSMHATAYLAYYCAALGDQVCARHRLNQALQLAPDNVRVQYMAALVYARSGDTRSANQAAQRALALGYPQALIATDPLLAPSWSERQFAAVGFSAIFVPTY
jgi:DNA-binding winged helix-turn-helix (wHTH) protein/TolB-like protein/cytochrome c-type biogenesis protein CcmH/NrfG